MSDVSLQSVTPVFWHVIKLISLYTLIHLSYNLTGYYTRLNYQVADSRTFWRDFDIHINFQVNDH